MASRIVKLISEITFWAGLALSALSIYILVSSGINLPARNCPVNNGRPFMIAAAAILAVSFISSFFTHRNKNKGEDKKNN